MIGSEEQARAYVADIGGDGAMAKLDQFSAMLRAENEEQNLVAQASLDSVWVRHIADSAQLVVHVSRETSPWLDLGTGAGLPGLVVAILCPAREVILVESRRRRIDWLERCITGLGLKNCRVEGKRLELVDSFETAVISARAFAPLPKLLDLSARFSTARTEWVLPKGRSAEQEWAALKPKRRKLFHVEQSLTDKEAKILVGKGRVAS